MSYFMDVCLICLKYSNNLIHIKSQDTSGTSIEYKLKYFLPEHELNSNIPKNICDKCGNNMNEAYKFKRKCLQNITKFEKYAQQISTTNGSYKCLSAFIRPDFVYEKAKKLNDNNYNENTDSQTEKVTDIVDSKDFIVEQEFTKELILNDELESLLYDIKEEKSVSDALCNKNNNVIKEKPQISNNSVPFSTGNENIGRQDEKEQYKCDVCHKVYFTQVNLKRHIRLHGLMSYKYQNNNVTFSENGDLKQVIRIYDDKKLHKCKICSKSFKFSQDLENHRLTHATGHPYTCEICEKSFQQLQHLKCHHLIHTGGKPHACEVCSKSFRHLHHLKIHSMRHTDEKPFTCEICHKSYRHLQTLNQHKLLHTCKEPYTCKVCNESFRHPQTLKRHGLIHTGEKPYTCEVCNESFRQIPALKQHKLLHSGEKPYTCEVCNKSFRHSQTLKHHKFLHTGEKPFTCEFCNESFRQFNHLKRHRLTHTGEKPFTCDICNSSFTTKQNLQSHLRVHYKYKDCDVKFP